GSLSTDALRTTVVVSVSMTEDGKPVVPSIRMRSFSGGSQASAQQAFDSARRAIIRCGTRGYDLPAEKYALWQEIEMTFNPEKMRIK
ncbi:MAG: energy transducer TonB, partial [Lutimaribacter sp.]